MNVNWNGVYPAITTKFTQSGDLDLTTFELNIQAQLRAGVHGIIIGGTLGEASTLQHGEKLDLIKTTLNIADGKIPVLMNIAEQKTADAISAAEDAEQSGANGLMLLPPMRYKSDDRETVHFMKSVAKSTSLPILIYNNPVDYGIEITPSMFEQLLEHDNIQAVKESTRDITNVTRIINRFDDRIKVMCGVDTIALESLLMGASGWVAGLVCAFPRETVAIYELAKQHRIDEALKIYRWFMPLLELDIVPKLVQNIKLAEVATGIGTEFVREPRLPLAGTEREHVSAVINDALKKHDEIQDILDSIESRNIVA